MYCSLNYFAIAPVGWYICYMKARNMACLLLVVLSLTCLMLFSSCKRASSEIPVGEQELPDMELRNADYTLGDPDRPLVMHASSITIYSGGRDTVMTDISFTQGTEFSGSCRSALVASDNKSARLSGDVIIRRTGESEDDNVTIQAQDVVWDGHEDTLSCTGEVRLEYGDGTVIKAEGLDAKLDEDYFEFGRILEGTLR